MNTSKKNLTLSGKMLLLGGILGYFISYTISGSFSFFRGDWGIPLIVGVFGVIGTLIGIMFGVILSFVGRIIVPHDTKLGIIIGGTGGFASIMYFWYTACWLSGVPICLSQ